MAPTKTMRSVEDRFWAKVQKRVDGCWEWTGWRLPKGYAYISLGRRSDGRKYVHRWSYERFVGSIPKGCQVDHLCHNPWCVNPAHLEAVPPQINVQRQRTTKLTAADVGAIRQSAESNRVLGRRYGVDRSVISRVRSGLAWR